MKVRLAPILALVAALALAIAGCGGSGSGDSGSSAAGLMAPDTQVLVEFTRPDGEAAANAEALARSIGGVDALGPLIVKEFEKSAASNGESFDYQREVEPWLGESGVLGFDGYDGENFKHAVVAIQSTDPQAARAFIDHLAKTSEQPAKDASYEGVDYKAQADGGSFGMIGEFVALASDEAGFKSMVDASEGESLPDVGTYADAVSTAPSDALANAFVDIGGIVEAGGEPIDAETQAGLSILGIEPKGATAVVSALPGSEEIEVDLSSDALADPPPAGDASALLGSLPAGSVAALASPDAGKTFGTAIDRLDREGLAAEGVPPHALKGLMETAGIDLDSIAASVGDAAAFLEGATEGSLGGSAVLETDDAAQAEKIVASVGTFLRATGSSGVTALSGKLSGFSVRNSDLGGKPLVVAASGTRIVVAYGLPSAGKAIAEAGRTLSETPSYEEAAASLGDTPISGFADGRAALRLASALIPAEDKEGFREAKRYLGKIDFLALGSESSDDLAKAKLIVGIGR